MKEDKILLIIDCQNDFITGSLAVKGADEMTKQLARYICENGQQYKAIIYTLDSHPYNHCSFKDNGGQWPTHCVMMSEGWNMPSELLDAIKQCEAFSAPIYKGMDPNQEEYSAVANEENVKTFKGYIQDAEHIDVCGIMSEYCVHDTVEAICKLDANPNSKPYSQRLRVMTDFIATADGRRKLRTLQNEFSDLTIV